ncbi:hypothetical protein [Rhodococcus sp. IEGM 1379]|uniref:variant leucine-rich repeat-containing protein n=1 Tax=Rhodococcus sp. IEGM 1379 TaxID=3047086 RepID=UPI0024B79325|nr:hypothetical protein [Rhodococcus sp. IEGM 1379]MDI9914320.1 hypothetical protein [Rhodococcus sp. IEGM 1379]
MNQPNSIAIAPGEVVRFSEQFCPNMILTHLTTTVTLTDKRIIVRRPNTLFGIIPMGYNEHASPISHIAQVSAGESFSTKLIGAGTVFLIWALMSFIGLDVLGTLFGLLQLAIAIACFFKAHHLAFVIRNTGAGTLVAQAAKSERNKVAYAQAAIRDLLFGDGTALPMPPAPSFPNTTPPSSPNVPNTLTTPAFQGSVPFQGSAPFQSTAPAPRFTAEQASNPNTSQALLSQIAEHEPSLRVLVAANPNCYPGLITWLRAIDDPDINRALSSRVSV